MLYNKKVIKTVARVLFLALGYQLVLPNVVLALTSGPSQPEVQSFEPVGTTDMVDMFSGDFVYNIPLLDVEGYPVNISYHGGVTMEQEASWVGLGWNINPGSINRTVRGLPDDFNGQTLDKQIHIKDENTLKLGITVVGNEFAGLGDPFMSLSAEIGGCVTMSNYKGVSADFNFGAGLNVFRCVSMGVNIGVGSQSGATINYDAGLSLSSALIASGDIASGGIGINAGSSYNTRTGLKSSSFSVSVNAGANGYGSAGVGLVNANIPIGIQNFVPVITNSSTMSSVYGRFKFGGEVCGWYPYGAGYGMQSNVHYNNDGSRNAYGYLYLQNAPGADSAILDFTRDKDGMFNKSMQYLPPGNMTYDIYNVSGQGTGGNFRAFRNDFGSVYDPVTRSSAEDQSVQGEAGLGNIVEGGVDFTSSHTDITSGPWPDHKNPFTGNQPGNIYESAYFKAGGELTAVDPSYFSVIGNSSPIYPSNTLPQTKPNSAVKRDARGNLLYYRTAAEASTTGVGMSTAILSYPQKFGSQADTPQVISRYVSNNDLGRRADQISEITQLQKDGRRYVYGIPCMNNIQKEATFSVNPPDSANLAKGLVSYSATDESTGNSKGLENYYSSTVTPSYAHTFLLTSVLSTDYVDVTGDGPSDDDAGSFTKLNYTRVESDYRWKAPFDDTGKAQYNPGFWSETRDDKANLLIGSREEWMLHSIESKNFIAEFYTSKRNDAMGCTDKIVSSGIYNSSPYNTKLSDTASSYKLDSIKLYNKHDRFINGDNAIPIKTVMFVYDYKLCPGVRNFRSGSGTPGKLTLEKIYTRYGNSDKSTISPYQFNYSNCNPKYDLAAKDRWGNYKKNDSTLPNYIYPYVEQSDDSLDYHASAWSLTGIRLPSGGVIQANYEADDYAFVQDQFADQMMKIDGVGPSPLWFPWPMLDGGKNFPFLYIYFDRKPGTTASQYVQGLKCLYYNVSVNLRGNYFERIKGYAEIDANGWGDCDAVHSYIRVKPVTPVGGGALLNPITYTAINTGRYYLPQIIYPGNNPNNSDLDNIVTGLTQSFNDLFGLGSNKIASMAEDGDGQILGSGSFIRLANPDHYKKGGGHRIKSLLFYDSWNSMVGGKAPQATYGKTYDYTLNDPSYGTISSGVASYEPMIGGDENSMRNPVPYINQSGNKWPPSDPVALYQETPIGESLFPGAMVGYSQITVKNIHSDVGRSAQGFDVYQFFTARDYPAQVKSNALKVDKSKSTYKLASQTNQLWVEQGFSLIFNDMHGKPKSVYHYANQPKLGQPIKISGEEYIYNGSPGYLDNNVDVLSYDMNMLDIVKSQRQLGVEVDVTTDTRWKKEMTSNNTLNTDFNFGIAWIFPVFVGAVYGWQGSYLNEFKSATVTKVVQQYGILKQVQRYNESAVTYMTNEIFDPETGQPIVTSINNEFKDKEYTVNVPAYWGYRNMGPAYSNIGLEEKLSSIFIDATTHMGNMSSSLAGYYTPGDELEIIYTSGGYTDTADVWVMDKYSTICSIGGNNQLMCWLQLYPRFPTATPGWADNTTLYNVKTKIICSGMKNQLNESIQNYTMMGDPCIQKPGTGYYALNDNPGKLISTSARTFTVGTKGAPTDFVAPLHRYIVNPDTLNGFAQGIYGIYKLQAEYAYMNARTYGGGSRSSGLFQAPCAWQTNNLGPLDGCMTVVPYVSFNPSRDIGWKTARQVSKWSPFGKEIENIDAIGNYSTAQYGYNEELPVGVASNASQGEILAEGFEDFSILQPKQNLLKFFYSPFKALFDTQSVAKPGYMVFKTVSPAISLQKDIAHSGRYSFLVPDVTNVGGSDGYIVNITTRPTSTYEYMPCALIPGKKYIMSYWLRSPSLSNIQVGYALPITTGIVTNSSSFPMVQKTSLINGWQQIEVSFTAGSSNSIKLPLSYYVDDLRIFPADANMKSFVYNPINEKLMAILDENNFATFYEYDQEGNLIRTKKETEKGIMTVSESRSTNPLPQP